jgi:hypothetical protein
MRTNDPSQPYKPNTTTTAPTKAAACGLPIEYTLVHDEPVIFNYSGTEQCDRVQVTMSLRQLAFICEALPYLRSAGLSGSDGQLAAREAIGELSDQLVAFWGHIFGPDLSHAGAHARALRLSNRDGFHSDQAGVDA